MAHTGAEAQQPLLFLINWFLFYFMGLDSTGCGFSWLTTPGVPNYRGDF